MANIIEDIIQQIDLFEQTLQEADFKILEKIKTTLENQINYKQTVSVLAYALGATDVNTIKEEGKLRTIEALIELIKVRREYRENIIKNQKDQLSKKKGLEELKMLGI